MRTQGGSGQTGCRRTEAVPGQGAAESAKCWAWAGPDAQSVVGPGLWVWGVGRGSSAQPSKAHVGSAARCAAAWLRRAPALTGHTGRGGLGATAGC